MRLTLEIPVPRSTAPRVLLDYAKRELPRAMVQYFGSRGQFVTVELDHPTHAEMITLTELVITQLPTE